MIHSELVSTALIDTPPDQRMSFLAEPGFTKFDPPALDAHLVSLFLQTADGNERTINNEHRSDAAVIAKKLGTEGHFTRWMARRAAARWASQGGNLMRCHSVMPLLDYSRSCSPRFGGPGQGSGGSRRVDSGGSLRRSILSVGRSGGRSGGRVGRSGSRGVGRLGSVMGSPRRATRGFPSRFLCLSRRSNDGAVVFEELNRP